MNHLGFHQRFELTRSACVCLGKVLPICSLSIQPHRFLLAKITSPLSLPCRSHCCWSHDRVNREISWPCFYSSRLMRFVQKPAENIPAGSKQGECVLVVSVSSHFLEKWSWLPAASTMHGSLAYPGNSQNISSLVSVQEQTRLNPNKWCSHDERICGHFFSQYGGVISILFRSTMRATRSDSLRA